MTRVLFVIASLIVSFPTGRSVAADCPKREDSGNKSLSSLLDRTSSSLQSTRRESGNRPQTQPLRANRTPL